MKTAYITGASRGLGRSIAEHLADSGRQGGKAGEEYALALGYRETDPGNFPNSIALKGDVARSETSETAVAAISERFGRLDLFIANAGIEGNGLLSKLDERRWDEVVGVNLSGPFYGIRACAPLLEKSGGKIIVIGSRLGETGSAGASCYASVKSALIGLAMSAARELAPRVSVNVFLPGYMNTAMGASSPRGMAMAEEAHLLGGLSKVDDAAAAVVAVTRLAGVTGQIFRIDGRVSRWY